MNLVAPDGSTLDVDVVDIQHEANGVVATFRLDGDAWRRVRRDQLLHVEPGRILDGEALLEGSDSIDVEAALDPDVDLPDGADVLSGGLPTGAWWALNATREVELPADLAGEGTLREGVALLPPPWHFDGDLLGAWNAIAPLIDEDAPMADEPMLQLIVGMLEELDWKVDRPDQDVTIISAPIDMDDGEAVLWVRTSEDQYLATVYSLLELEVPEDKVGAMAELAARLNKQVYVGGFEADPDTGAFQFRNGIDVEGAELTVPLARQLLGHAIVAAQKSFLLALAVAEGRYEPAHAANRF